MTIPRTACVSLLSALLICAFAAQSASAAVAVNTTTVTCVKGKGDLDFLDEHCDEKVEKGKGSFGHEAIAGGTKTTVSVTNAGTQNGTKEAAPTIIKGTVFGVKHEITCQTTSGEGSLTNSEPVVKQHKVTGTVTINYTSCTVNKPAGFGCEVKQPITLKSNVEGVEGLGAGKNEMGLEFKPAAGETFEEITIANCVFAGTSKITGIAIGTGTPKPTEKHGGATYVFTNAMTKETLKWAGNSVEISGSTTVTMSGGGNPVALTTTT